MQIVGAGTMKGRRLREDRGKMTFRQGSVDAARANADRPPHEERPVCVVDIVLRDCWLAMCGSGGDRLSRVLRHSTMGAGVFNGRVRDGIGFWARRSGHQTGASQFFWDWAAQGAATAGVLFGKHVVAVVAHRRGRPLVFL
jgi:hypothetical protein